MDYSSCRGGKKTTFLSRCTQFWEFVELFYFRLLLWCVCLCVCGVCLGFNCQSELTWVDVPLTRDRGSLKLTIHWQREKHTLTHVCVRNTWIQTVTDTWIQGRRTRKNIEILSAWEKKREKKNRMKKTRRRAGEEEGGRARCKERWKWRWKERCLVNKVLSTTSPGESTLPYPLRLDISLCRSHSLSCCDTRGTRCNHRGTPRKPPLPFTQSPVS